MNLRHVEQEEADDVRAFLDTNRIEYYETKPSRWLVSAGGIWIRDNADYPRARQLMDDYQADRQKKMREQHAQRIADGQSETFISNFKQQPMRVLLMIAAIIGLILLMLLPGWLLRQ